MRILSILIIIAFFSIASAQDLFQTKLYTFCNNTATSSSECVLGSDFENIHSSYPISGAVPFFGNYPYYYDKFSTSYAYVDYCEEGNNNYIGYVVNPRYSCPPTITNPNIYIYAYIFNGSSFIAGSYETQPICDNTIRQHGGLTINISAVKDYYNISFPFAVYHSIRLNSTSGSGNIYVEGEGELLCIKNKTKSSLLNGNGGFDYIIDKPYIAGFKSIPIIYQPQSIYTSFVNYGCYSNSGCIGTSPYDDLVERYTSVLDFFMPFAEKVAVSFNYNSLGPIRYYVTLTNNVDYTNTYSFDDEYSTTYKTFYHEFILTDTIYRKFSLYIYTNTSGYFIDDISISAFNITLPPTPTTTIPATTIPTVTTTTSLPYNVYAEISQISVSDNTPTIGQEIRIRVKITNIGLNTWNFPVGISIGKNGIYCNRDCYVDGKGDYVYTGNIHSGQTVEVERVFKFRDEYFDYGQSYDLLVGVYAYPYMPPSQAYDYKVLNNYFTIVPLEQKLDAFPISVKASKPKVAKDDYIDITSYILNNGSIPYNFTIGMSIGIWDTNTGVFKNYKPSLLPPCNTECYVDDKGDWIYAIIPPNYTDPIKRSFKIPDYFLDDNPFDVAIGIYTDRPENGGKLISISYFKNVSKTTTEPSVTQQLAGHAKSAIYAFMIMSSTAFGIPISGAKILFVVFIESLVIYLVFRYNQTGVDNKIVILSLVMLMTFAFTAIGWFPLILAIIVILVAGFILYSIIRG